MLTVGKKVIRKDARAKLTGEALYADDIRVEGALYGVTVRSPFARAEILGIEREEGFDWGDITVVTAEDIPGSNEIFLMTSDQPALADRFVKHVAEPVALVAAPTFERAVEAARHLKVSYRELPALLDPLESEGNENVIFPPDNIFKKIEIHKGDPDSVEEGILVEGEYRTGLHEQLYIEPQGMVAIPGDGGKLTIIGSMQCPYYVRKALDKLLGPDKVNIIQAVTGGGFGGKEEYPSMVAAHAALLALKSGRPVKLIYRRDEDLVATTKRHPSIIKLRARVREDGTFLALWGEVLMDGGAYNTLSPVVLSRAVIHLTGPYRWEHVDIVGKMVATNRPPNGAFRGFGAPQAHFAIERHVDKIASALGMDPVEIRRKNLLRPGDETATGQVLKDASASIVLEEALKAAEAELPPLFTPPGVYPQPRRLAFGRGVALAFHGCGFTGNGEAIIKGKVALQLKGDRVFIKTSITDMGQGADTVLPQITAEALGIDVSRVEIAPHETDQVPDSGPTVASRSTMVVGKVCRDAAQKLKEALAAETGLSPAEDFDTLLKARKSEVPLEVEEFYRPVEQLTWDAENYRGDAYPTYGWNCTVVDLAVDLDTGEVTYRRAISATDVGKAINPVAAAGQLQGGTLQALGWATSEEVITDENGRVKNNTLSTYIIPTALDAPEIKAILVENPYPGGPFGAKGIGEIPMDCPAAAVAQAIQNATGVFLDRLPMTPERILSALEEKKS